MYEDPNIADPYGERFLPDCIHECHGQMLGMYAILNGIEKAYPGLLEDTTNGKYKFAYLKLDEYELQCLGGALSRMQDHYDYLMSKCDKNDNVSYLRKAYYCAERLIERVRELRKWVKDDE